MQAMGVNCNVCELQVGRWVASVCVRACVCVCVCGGGGATNHSAVSMLGRREDALKPLRTFEYASPFDTLLPVLERFE